MWYAEVTRRILAMPRWARMRRVKTAFWWVSLFFGADCCSVRMAAGGDSPVDEEAGGEGGFRGVSGVEGVASGD